MPSSLDILLKRFREDILELGFEASEKGFNDMKRVALEYQRQARLGQTSEKRVRETYKLYIEMIELEGDEDFLNGGRYPEY